MRKLIVLSLVWLCAAIDRTPTYTREDGWHASGWGCYPLRLAHLSDTLDTRWNTGVWS